MFILDFFLGGLMDQLIDWIYSQLVGFFGNFFAAMGNMGVELFDMEWVQSIVLFFSYLGWALYGVGLVVAVFEVGIECQTGRANVKDAALNAIKGFMAVGCFTLVPVELYKLSVTLQASLTAGITGYGEGFDVLSTDNCKSRSDYLETAAQFYAGYLSGEEATAYLPPALVAAMRGTVQD
uniref:conjugal transfer protein TrbL family protein n=1 Tax=Anaerotruncus rubiinfantis TaxID=1720200 RepID=UPI0034A1B702